jgi:hypothetical protein
MAIRRLDIPGQGIFELIFDGGLNRTNGRVEFGLKTMHNLNSSPYVLSHQIGSNA